MSADTGNYWLGALLMAGVSWAQGSSSIDPPVAQASSVAKTAHFAFESHPLMNLHHFLYQWARADADHDLGPRRRPVAVAERSADIDLEVADAEVWTAALEYYTANLVAKDLLFDATMDRLKQRIVGGAVEADESELESTVLALLEEALPVYARYWWPNHDRANRAWVKAACARLEGLEQGLATEIAHAYGGTWPDAAIRVDVCAYANWAGAYTSNRPNHITLASTDENSRGAGAVEVLLHEASHTSSLIRPLREALERAFGAHGTAPPRDLWHALIFYTAGETTRKAVARQENHVPYAERVGLWEGREWKTLRAALDEHWKIFLGGAISREEALAGLAETLSRH